MLLFRRLWLVLFNLEKGHNCKTIRNVKVHQKQLPWRNGAKYSESGTKSDNFTVNYLYKNPWQMTYWLFEIVLINLCNKYYLFKLKYVWCICVYSNRSIQIMLEYFCYRFLSCTCSVWAAKKHWLFKCLLSSVTDQDIVFSGTWFMLSYDNKR